MADRRRYSIDLTEFDQIIDELAKKEGRKKSNMVHQLLREALQARGEIK